MLKKVLLYVLASIAALLLLWEVLVLTGTPLPANFLRARLMADFNQDLAPLTVELKGPLAIIPAWGLDVRARELALIDPQAKGGPLRVARVKSLDLAMRLTPLLWGEVDIQRCTARQLRLSLMRGGNSLLFPLVAGHLFLSGSEARLEDLVLDLGASRLTGRASLREGKPPRLEINLVSPQADLEDLYAVMGLGRPTHAQELAQTRHQMLTSLDRGVRAALGAFEGEIKVRADQLRLRGTPLGKARLHLTLKNRRLLLDPLLIELPHGTIKLSDEIVARGKGLASQLNFSVRNLGYRMLAKEAKLAAGGGGRISLRIDLSAAAPTLGQLLAHANGIVQVGIWPKDLEDRAYSLWTANLVFGLLRSMVSKYDSKVNCAIADMVMREGVLTQRQLTIDTSKLRVKGTAKINFKKQTIDMELTPRAKTPQFFSLETPITIKGTFADFSTGVAPSSLVGSVIHFAASPIFAPLRRLFGDTLPEAGKDVCRSPETWPPPVKEQSGREK